MTTFTVTRRGRSPATIHPTSMRLTPASFGVERTAGIQRGRLRVPAGWRVEGPAPLAWFVTPSAEKLSFDTPTTLWLEIEYEDGTRRTFARNIGIALDVQTTFDPEKHAWPERNSASVIGNIGPSREIFEDTYCYLPRIMSTVLYRGLYSDIVQLRRSGSHRGGLCSGMARWAGLRAIRGEDTLPERAVTLRQIITLHGRQLTDRAILSSVGWFLRASPSAAYRTIRDESFATGLAMRALDVGVPKPWRRDLARAVIREGHTIVPYRIRQPSPTRAFVDCYDPNRGREPHTIEFHLDTDRYAYRHIVSFEEDNVGLIAVPHVAYAEKGSAYLATIGSLVWLAFGIGRASKSA